MKLRGNGPWRWTKDPDDFYRIKVRAGDPPRWTTIAVTRSEEMARRLCTLPILEAGHARVVQDIMVATAAREEEIYGEVQGRSEATASDE